MVLWTGERVWSRQRVLRGLEVGGEMGVVVVVSLVSMAISIVDVLFGSACFVPRTELHMTHMQKY